MYLSEKLLGAAGSDASRNTRAITGAWSMRGHRSFEALKGYLLEHCALFELSLNAEMGVGVWNYMLYDSPEHVEIRHRGARRVECRHLSSTCKVETLDVQVIKRGRGNSMLPCTR